MAGRMNNRRFKGAEDMPKRKAQGNIRARK
jgi:hypothetical protein